MARLFPLRLSHKYAITRDLAHVVVSLCSLPNGANPTALSKLIAEMHHIEGDTRRLVALLCQRVVSERQRAVVTAAGMRRQPVINAVAAEQRTLLQVWSDPADPRGPKDLSANDLGVNGGPGHGYLRKLVISVERERRDFVFLWREQNVGGTIFQVCHVLCLCPTMCPIMLPLPACLSGPPSPCLSVHLSLPCSLTPPLPTRSLPVSHLLTSCARPCSLRQTTTARP